MKEAKERKTKENINKKTKGIKQQIKDVKKESSIDHKLPPKRKSRCTVIFYKLFLLNCKPYVRNLSFISISLLRYSSLWTAF